MSQDRCACRANTHEPKLVVLTGGPGAGKTAVLELARKYFCQHVHIVPEAAGILFGGGFPRVPTDVGRRAVQQAIFHVQTALEDLAMAENAAVTLCDRGTVDSLAYWPGAAEAFWAAVGSSLADQLKRYSTIIHLRTPPLAQGYNHQNALRIESADEALRIDARIADAWSQHPRLILVQSIARDRPIRSSTTRWSRSARPSASPTSLRLPSRGPSGRIFRATRPPCE